MHAEEVGLGEGGESDPAGNEGRIQMVGEVCSPSMGRDVAESCDRSLP